MTGPPIFVLGITARSGTNYLARLLCRHPACSSPAPIFEDHFLFHANHLRDFVEKVQGKWPQGWRAEPEAPARLMQALGAGLVAFLAERARGKRLVTKSPSLRNLPLFFALFPDARLLITIRDGRAVVESMVRSFNVTYETATARWQLGAEALLDFMRQGHKHADKCEIVRYEELYLHCEVTLRRIFAFLDLPADVYDFTAARDLPVYGSSVFRGENAEKVHWRPVPKTPEFRPLERWRDWNDERLTRFNDLAGPSMEALGYRLSKDGASAAGLA